jgi:hypothetical protein
MINLRFIEYEYNLNYELAININNRWCLQASNTPGDPIPCPECCNGFPKGSPMAWFVFVASHAFAAKALFCLIQRSRSLVLGQWSIVSGLVVRFPRLKIRRLQFCFRLQISALSGPGPKQ